MDMISLHHINKSYGSHQVLNNVDLTINRGEIYGLIGKNGVGKTTLLKVILGLTYYDTGELSIAGSYKKISIRHNRRKIGFFINKNFFEYLNARDNLSYYCKLKGVKDIHEIERLLKLVGLKDDETPLSEYSLGMKQRLGIACALIGHPDILILDEPIHGLDPETTVDIKKLLHKLNSQGITMLISSHILGELEHIASRFGIIDHGRIIKEITMEDLKVQKETIQISIEDYEKACHVLHDNDIRILESSLSYKSLKDYYLEVVGGHLDG